MSILYTSTAREYFRQYRMLCAELRNARRMSTRPTPWAKIAAEEVVRLEREIGEVAFAYFEALASERGRAA